MAGAPWDGAGNARRALHGIVSDPSFGTAALSQPTVMSNLLKDLLPDAPREAGLIVAAAQADLAGALRGYLAQGMDLGTAARLTAGSFINNTSHTPEACSWVVNELAVALGVDSAGQPPPTQAASPAQDPVTVQAPATQSPWASPSGPGGAPAWPPPGPAGHPVPVPPGPAPWPVPPPRPASAVPPSARLAGILGLAGALFVLLGCAVPWLNTGPGGQSVSVFSGFKGSPISQTFWYSAEPIAVLIAAIVLGLVLLAGGSRNRFVPGLLTGFGIQTTLLFAGYTFTVYAPAHHGAGGAL